MSSFDPQSGLHADGLAKNNAKLYGSLADPEPTARVAESAGVASGPSSLVYLPSRGFVLPWEVANELTLSPKRLIVEFDDSSQAELTKLLLGILQPTTLEKQAPYSENGIDCTNQLTGLSTDLMSTAVLEIKLTGS
jgi:hypothetical protein